MTAAAMARAGLRKPQETRRDALPEHLTYRDTGCSLARSCLRCPLPVCRYDAALARQSAKGGRL